MMIGKRWRSFGMSVHSGKLKQASHNHSLLAQKNVIKTYIAGTCIMSVTCRITGNILLLSN